VEHEARLPRGTAIRCSGLTVFEWEAGGTLLVQRWEIPHPQAPDGIAIVRFDDERRTYLQHYFDSRGVARVYEMSYINGVWKLSRTTPDLSALEFSQRFTGTFSADGTTIVGRWEISHDNSHWEHDFDLVYTKLSTARVP
jgi:hypothetical protein